MIRTLASHIGEFKKDSFLTPVYVILEVIFEMIIPLLMASIIDDGVEAGNITHIYKIGAVMLILAVLSLASGVMAGVHGARASAGFARNLRNAMFDRIQTFSFSNIDKFSTAGLVTRMTTDVTNVQNAYQMILRMCTRAPFCMIIAMVMSFVINPQLACIYLAAVFFLGCVIIVIVSHAMGNFREAFKRYDDLNSSVQENVNSIRVVKAYVRGDYETEKFTAASGKLYRLFIKAEKIINWNMPAMQLTVYGCILLISWFGAHKIVAGTMTTGNLMSLLTYCMNILVSLMMLSMVFVMISMSVASAERITGVLKEEPDIVNPADPCMEVTDGSISFDHVSFRYDKDSAENVLSDIDLEIRSGEMIGIIGATGSAKSSLVSLISRLYDVNEGNVKVGGRDVREYDMEVLRNEVSVVLQKNVLFSGSILDNLRWGDPQATEEQCIQACRLACADEFIEKMPEGYNTHIEQGGTNVSGGQRQRLCIARALLKKPKILILDDSTSAVDTATDAKIRKAFREEIPSTTKLIIAQRISSVQEADRIIVLKDGRINGFGTHEQLLASNDIYRDVYESQTSGSGDFDENGGEM